MVRRIPVFLLCFTVLAACAKKEAEELQPEGPKVYDVGGNKIIHALSFSPDGKQLLAGGEDKMVRILEPEINAIKWESPLRPASVLAVTYTGDGSHFVIGVGDNGSRTAEVALFKSDSRDLVWVLDNLGYDQSAVAVSNNKKWLAAASSYNITIYDFETGKTAQVFKGHEMDVAAPTGHTGAVSSLCFTSDDKTLVSGAWDENVKLWDLEKGKEARTLIDAEPINEVVLTRDDHYVISAAGDIKIWNIETGVADFILDHRSVEALTLSPDGKYLASGSQSGEIKIWSMESKKEILSWPDVHKKGIWALKFSPDGRHLASGGGDGIVKLSKFEPAESPPAAKP